MCIKMERILRKSNKCLSYLTILPNHSMVFATVLPFLFSFIDRRVAAPFLYLTQTALNSYLVVRNHFFIIKHNLEQFSIFSLCAKMCKHFLYVFSKYDYISRIFLVQNLYCILIIIMYTAG